MRQKLYEVKEDMLVVESWGGEGGVPLLICAEYTRAWKSPPPELAVCRYSACRSKSNRGPCDHPKVLLRGEGGTAPDVWRARRELGFPDLQAARAWARARKQIFVPLPITPKEVRADEFATGSSSLWEYLLETAPVHRVPAPRLVSTPKDKRYAAGKPDRLTQAGDATEADIQQLGMLDLVNLGWFGD